MSIAGRLQRGCVLLEPFAFGRDNADVAEDKATMESAVTDVEVAVAGLPASLNERTSGRSGSCPIRHRWNVQIRRVALLLRGLPFHLLFSKRILALQLQLSCAVRVTGYRWTRLRPLTGRPCGFPYYFGEC